MSVKVARQLSCMLNICSILYETKSVCVRSLCMASFGRISTNFSVASLYPPDGHGPVSKCWLHPQALMEFYIRHCKWVVSSVEPVQCNGEAHY